jgi:hypothetical protein
VNRELAQAFEGGPWGAYRALSTGRPLRIFAVLGLSPVLLPPHLLQALAWPLSRFSLGVGPGAASPHIVALGLSARSAVPARRCPLDLLWLGTLLLWRRPVSIVRRGIRWSPSFWSLYGRFSI